MRELSELDKKIIDRIIKAYDQQNLQGLQVARLLREELSLFAIEWEIKPKTLSIFAPQRPGDEGLNGLNKSFFDIANFLFLIEELEKCGYIGLHSIETANDGKYPKQLYDRDKYTKQGDIYMAKMEGTMLAVVQVDITSYYINIVDIMEKYAFKFIFPLHSLKEFKNRGYLTEEQKFRREEMELSRKSVSSAMWATWAAAIGVVLTAVSTIKSCTEDNKVGFDDTDMERIEEIVKTPSHIVIDNIDKVNADTIKVRAVDDIKPLPINLKVNVTPNQ